MSAGPWQGLDATASAERDTIRGSVAEPAAGILVEGQVGFAEPGLGMGEVGFLLDKSELQTIERRDHGPVDRNAFLFIHGCDNTA